MILFTFTSVTQNTNIKSYIMKKLYSLIIPFSFALNAAQKCHCNTVNVANFFILLRCHNALPVATLWYGFGAVRLTYHHFYYDSSRQHPWNHTYQLNLNNLFYNSTHCCWYL